MGTGLAHGGSGGGNVVKYDPTEGLKTVVVSEAAEKHWRRAKNAEKLYAAVKAKLTAQAEYVVWRDRTVKWGGDRKSSSTNKELDLPEGDPGFRVIHKWRKRLCVNTGGVTKLDSEKLKRATAIDTEKIARVLEEVGLACQRMAEFENIGTVRGTEGTGEFERYTPAQYIEAARTVLGEIDLDPATSKQAQKTIRALQYFTEKDDGLAQEWNGRVFLNPPYHRELAPKFIDKLVAEFTAGRVSAAILLTNNCTDTDWFDVAVRACVGLCFSHGRIKFHVPKGEDVLPTQGQTFFYFGDDVQRFEDVFCVVGFCVRPSRQYEETDA